MHIKIVVIYNVISKNYSCVKKLNKTKIQDVTHSKIPACQSIIGKKLCYLKKNELKLMSIMSLE